MKVHILLSSLSSPAWPSRDQGHQGPSCCRDPISHSPLGLLKPPASSSILSLYLLFSLSPVYSKRETKRSPRLDSLSWDSVTQMSFLPNGLGSLLTPQRTSAFYNFSNFSSQASCWSCPTGMKGDSRCCVSGSGSTCQSHGREGSRACRRGPEGKFLIQGLHKTRCPKNVATVCVSVGSCCSDENGMGQVWAP